jgi:hypothetical protein
MMTTGTPPSAFCFLASVGFGYSVTTAESGLTQETDTEIGGYCCDYT